MSHINYAFNPEDDALPRDKMKLRNIASTKYSGDWPSIPHSHSYAELGASICAIVPVPV